VKNNGDPTSSLSVLLAHCPERVLPGKILKELVDNDRVVGGLSQKATALATELYSKIVSGKIYPTDATTAEMVKLSENTFRDVNISLANELAIMCEKLGINVWEVVALANKHPRVNLLKPGPGVGGHCIAVDPWFLVYKFPQDAQVIRAARLRNDLMPKMVVEKILSLLGDKPGQKIACLGAAFKANVDDGRNSPAVEIFQMLTSALGEKGEVVLNDMHVSDPRLPLQNLEQVLERASLIVLLTDHDEYADLDPAKVAINVKAKVIFDTRNHLDHRRWRDAGFDVYLLGDGSNAS
jgi:UDP-N-acetyl-D-mannosaminuronic acid dehydrogenase